VVPFVVELGDMILPGLQRLLKAAEVPVMGGSGGTRRQLSLLQGKQLHSAYLQGGNMQTQTMHFEVHRLPSFRPIRVL
jgi:hypothetical protein